MRILKTATFTVIIKWECIEVVYIGESGWPFIQITFQTFILQDPFSYFMNYIYITEYSFEVITVDFLTKQGCNQNYIDVGYKLTTKENKTTHTSSFFFLIYVDIKKVSRWSDRKYVDSMRKR